MHYDVFNGDADGIIALLQLRLAEPKQATLVTGVKRDIKLVEQVVAAGDAVTATVLDISMEKNSAALQSLLASGVEVFYCDHHIRASGTRH
jgi:intracellular sulfur oxidation DsrE/DsrF family protein